LDELDENPNQTNISSLGILKERATRQRTPFLNHLTKNYVQWVQNI
jgi:hypothetical protein